MLPKIKLLLSIVSMLILVGCAAPRQLSNAAAKVHFQKQGSNLLGKCKEVGQVSGYGKDNFLVEYSFDVAKKDIRENAASIGADTVVITTWDDGPEATRVLGIAFKCF